MPVIKKFIEEGIRQALVDEFLAKELSRADYSSVQIRPTALGDRIILKAGRSGMVIGRRGRNIYNLTRVLQEKFNLNNPSIEVQEVKNIALDPRIMAKRLARTIERGHHYRRASYGILKKIMLSGAKGCEIRIRGKVTTQRARSAAFRSGFIAKCGEPAERFVRVVHEEAMLKRGLLGVTISIMIPNARLPDEIEVFDNVDLSEFAPQEEPVEEILEATEESKEVGEAETTEEVTEEETKEDEKELEELSELEELEEKSEE